MWLHQLSLLMLTTFTAAIFQYMLASCNVAWTFILNAKLNANGVPEELHKNRCCFLVFFVQLRRKKKELSFFILYLRADSMRYLLRGPKWGRVDGIARLPKHRNLGVAIFINPALSMNLALVATNSTTKLVLVLGLKNELSFPFFKNNIWCH